jgi:RNA polymerase sigma-70 factor (ECF subfamily)
VPGGRRLPDLEVDPGLFARELAAPARRPGLAGAAGHRRAAHVHLAIACAAGDELAIRRLDRDLLAGELRATGARLKARPELVEEVAGQLRRLVFTSEPGRQAAVSAFSGRCDLQSYLRVIATRELVKLIGKDRRLVQFDEDAIVSLIAPGDGPDLLEMRARYKPEVDAAIRAALVGLPAAERALLRYSVVDGWSIDRIAALYGLHRSTAARRSAARDQLAAAIRAEVARAWRSRSTRSTRSSASSRASSRCRSSGCWQRPGSRSGRGG